MSNIKRFNEFINEGVERIRSREELFPMQYWIEEISKKLDDMDEASVINFFTEIEDTFGENTAVIIDGRFSADKLHYNQTGTTVPTGGIDTGDFIEDFDNIKAGINNIIDKPSSDIEGTETGLTKEEENYLTTLEKSVNNIFTDTWLDDNKSVSAFKGNSFESIKRFSDFKSINEGSNIEELLANPENMWIVYIGEEPIGGMEYLNDAFNDVLLTRIADTEEEEYIFQDKVDDILSEIGSEYDDVDQEELNDAIDAMMNEMGKSPIYRIKKRDNI